jgi:hypothetical protein
VKGPTTARLRRRSRKAVDTFAGFPPQRTQSANAGLSRRGQGRRRGAGNGEPETGLMGATNGVPRPRQQDAVHAHRHQGKTVSNRHLTQYVLNISYGKSVSQKFPQIPAESQSVSQPFRVTHKTVDVVSTRVDVELLVAANYYRRKCVSS